MSALKLRATQLGISSTSTNNFVLKTADIPDATLRLYRGTLENLSTQILSVGADNVITLSSTLNGSITGNAGTVTNGVYTTGNQTIGGSKTFSSSVTISTAGDSVLSLNAVGTGNYAYLNLQQAGVTKWTYLARNTSSDLAIDRYVGGAWQNSPITIANSNGDVTLVNGGGWVYAKNKIVIGPLASVMAYNDSGNSLEIQNNGSTGDSNMAMMGFHCTGSYAIKLGVRNDGVFGLGGWSRAAWSWYSDSSGNMVAAGNVIAYSDPKLKENFKRVEDPLGILRALDGGTFDWKSGIDHIACKAGKRDYGILADQVEKVMPEIVYDSIDIDGEKYRMVAYEKLVPVLIEAVKKLEARVIELEGK